MPSVHGGSIAAPLSHDRSADIMGVDLSHHGLLCRAGGGCRANFDPATTNSEADLAAAGRKRDHHEVAFHDYHHVVIVPRAWAYTQKLSARGRSTLGK
jgi:hypothetical protein